MIIHSMTATFGKLEHEILELMPGLNLIQAPNEWGKSTWCAFLTAMLYGLDTRMKTTKTTLADKERYAPWSGSPMEGTMDITWQGRKITIQRRTKGRIPLGEFLAWETDTGLPVPELTAANCGRMLLGVEKSVFLRSAFLRQNDLPVTDDEALRRRLNALVTTGDEGGGGERLARGLREQKHRIRYNRTGLLPQAEGARTELENTLGELDQLRDLMDRTKARLRELAQEQRLLENHRMALAYEQVLADARQVDRAAQALTDAEARMSEIRAECADLPGRETAEQILNEICRLQDVQLTLQTRMQLLLPPEAEEDTGPFAGMDPGEAVRTALKDRNRWWELHKPRMALPLVGLVLLLCGVLALWYPIPGLACAAVGAVLLVAGLIMRIVRGRKADALAQGYGSDDPDDWLRAAECYGNRVRAYEQAQQDYRTQRMGLEQQLKELNENILTVTESMGLAHCRGQWEQVMARWDRLRVVEKELEQAKAHLETVKGMARSSPAPEFPDTLDLTPEETEARLEECTGKRHHLENLLGQYQGRMDALGDRRSLLAEKGRIDARIARLEQTYAALTIAQETLEEATAQLQRRFAPRIGARARELLGRMTEGRYDRLTLDRDLSLRAGAAQEDTLREALWRSDGTMDQLYLALRLAVAEVLVPGCPLVLDDALVRFDDRRLKAVLEILQEEAAKRQVLLFSCQSREAALLGTSCNSGYPLL